MSKEELWIEPAIYLVWWNPISWWRRFMQPSWWLMRSYENTASCWCIAVYRTKREAEVALDKMNGAAHA